MATSSRRHDTCSICLEAFVNPKIIDCHHTFCLKCLEDLVKTRGQNRQFVCPLCNKKIPIPEGGVKNFTSNFYIEDETSPTSTDKTTEYCKIHRQKEIELFCKYCHVNICSRCVIKTHKGHELQDLDTMRSETKMIQAIKSQLKTDTNKIQAHSDKITIKLLEIQDFVSITRENVDKQADTLCGQIRKMAEEMKHEVGTYLQEDTAKLHNLLKDNQIMKYKFTGITDVSDDLNFNELQDEINKGRQLHAEVERRNLDIPVLRYPRFKESELIKQELLGILEIFEGPDFKTLINTKTETISRKRDEDTMFNFNVDQIKHDDIYYYSPDIKTIQGLTWRVAAKRYPVGGLYLYLDLPDYKNTTIKECKVDFTLTLVNYLNRREDKMHQRTNTFHQGTMVWYHIGVHWEGFIDPRHGFVDQHGDFTVILKITNIHYIR